MKSQAAKMIAGLAITVALGVAASSVATGMGVGNTNMGGRGHDMSSMGGDKHGRQNMSNVATLLGMTPGELKAQLQSGKSLASVAATKNVEVSIVISAIVADISTRLDAQVASGKLTQAKVDAKLAKTVTVVTEKVHKVRPAGAKGRGGEGRGDKHGRQNMSNVATLLGMTSGELKAQLQSGKSLASVAATKNVEVSSVISAIVANISTRLDAQLASGKLTQAQVDAKLAKTVTFVTEMVNKVHTKGTKP